VRTVTDIRPLSWGRRYLMCRPEHFRVDYAINPWMDVDSPVDPELALAQWDRLAATIEAAGAVVERIAQLPEAPDMVYAMNYGLVDGDHVAVTSFRHPERAVEAEAAEWWFAEAGLRTSRVADADVGSFEAGDAFLVGDSLVVAAGPRTDLATHDVLSRTFGVRVTTVGVVHPALYHLDLSLCPLDERRAIVAPDAWDAAGRATVARLVPEPLVLDQDEAFTFAANSVVVGDVVVMPAGVPVRVTRQLERWGFTVATVEISELHKGGGSVRCMTLPLDTVLDDARLPVVPSRRHSGGELVPA
jgi:N-dimethylarginine dimethylaminohydrolase